MINNEIIIVGYNGLITKTIIDIENKKVIQNKMKKFFNFEKIEGIEKIDKIEKVDKIETSKGKSKFFLIIISIIILIIAYLYKR
jgi:hypothetical protein